MNPLLLIGVLVVVAGVVIDVLNKQKQAKENETLEVSPDADAEVHNDSPDRLDDSPDSGDIPAPSVSKDSIHLDS